MRSKYYLMKRFALIILTVGICLSLQSYNGLHKFYVSVTNVDYEEEQGSLQIISRIFVDDMENALKTRYDLDARLGTPEEDAEATEFIGRYFNAKFTVWVNGDEREYTFLGKRYDDDLIICYLEVTGIPKETLSSVGIQNEILTDIFEEQKNLVHLKVLGNKKSFVLVRENNKGMLNL